MWESVISIDEFTSMNSEDIIADVGELNEPNNSRKYTMPFQRGLHGYSLPKYK